MFYIILILAITVIVYEVFPIYRAEKINSDMKLAVKAFEQHPNNVNLKILVVGDSTGVGTGSNDSKKSTAGRLASDLPNSDIQNISENGLKIEGLLKKINKIDAHYDLVLIQIGANDIVGLTPYAEIRKELMMVLDRSENIADNIIILTSGNVGSAPVFHWPLSLFYTYRTLKVRSIYIEEVGKYKNIKYVDLYKDKKDDIFLTDINKYYAIDKFHPSAEGYGIWYEQIRPSIDKVLK